MALARTPEVNHRESLYYLWLASIAILIFGLSAFLIWFTLPSPLTQTPRIFMTFNVVDVPALGSVRYFPGQQLYLSHTDNDELIAFDSVTPNVGCLLRWFALIHRFDEPCRGAKWRLDGTVIEGTRYELNRYYMTITFTDGQTVSTNYTGDPIPLEGQKIASVSVDICHRIEGKKETNVFSGPVYSLRGINPACIR